MASEFSAVGNTLGPRVQLAKLWFTAGIANHKEGRRERKKEKKRRKKREKDWTR